MENFFTSLNIRLTEKQPDSQSSRLLIVANTDGSPRWVINANAKEPLFLKFYSVTSLRARLFAFAIKMIYQLKLQKIIFNTKTVYFSKNSRSIINLQDRNWALFTGTVGPNNKILVFEKTEHKTFFYKVATTEAAVSLLDNEKKALDKLQKIGPVSFTLPASEQINAQTLKLEDISIDGERSIDFNQRHRDALTEIYKSTCKKLDIFDLPIYRKMQRELDQLETSTDPRLPKGLIEKLRMLADTIQNDSIAVSFSHGDFTPWNMYQKNNSLAIYDWELSMENTPIGFDAFHFMIQQGILVDRFSWKQIKQKIDLSISQELFKDWSDSKSIKFYLKIYLLLNTVSQLSLFSKQDNWHIQVTWLINTWNNALSDLVATDPMRRGLLIRDFFDFMNDKHYAAIKLSDKNPSTLSIYSDIDLCIEKHNYKDILLYLKSHSFVLKAIVTKKSFMANVQVFLDNGDILSIDLIWKFKRNALAFMDAKKIISNSYTNAYGVKNMGFTDTARYIGLFYGLNNAEIPAKYQDYEQLLIGKTDSLDKLLYSKYLDANFKNIELVKSIKRNKMNKGVTRLINSFHYIIDSLKQFIMQKGLIITFSGVDGAGKSTIIEKVKYEIEKKLRKQVVVIRHRPSLLPILSVWTKGKEKAHEDVISRLPRQGGNKSTISSFIRFSYYYADYLFGQFYIYFKYVLRGKVVLYDRYYFDFINDGKRSNIQLPKSITKFGYKFLLQPDINIFLYADPDVILARKKELTKETIVSLTQNYLSLFKQLGGRSKKKYIAIENLELDNTLGRIMDETISKMAS